MYTSEGTLYGPMHSQAGIDLYKQALEEAKAQGGKIECGGKVSWGLAISFGHFTWNYVIVG